MLGHGTSPKRLNLEAILSQHSIIAQFVVGLPRRDSWGTWMDQSSSSDDATVDEDEALAERYWTTLLEPWLALYAERMESLTHLAHYCTFATLAGIVGTEELWFSPPTLMNDINEIIAGKQMIIQNADYARPLGSAMRVLEQNAPTFWALVRQDFEERFVTDLEHTFISCWSECRPTSRSHDQLTMWRGYAGEGNGVAVVADVSFFAGGEFDIIACPVFYETPEAFAARADKAVRAFLVQYMNIDREDRAKFEWLAVAAFSDLIFYLSVSHKHEAFAAEAEWRFVWRRRPYFQGDFDRFVKAKVSPRGLFERFCLPIDGSIRTNAGWLDMRDMITEVMVGPCEDQDAQVNGVRRLLEDAGFDGETTAVTRSQIPFRHKKP